jgi:pimeloyl-ACP methyl ester carboxylesterase
VGPRPTEPAIRPEATDHARRSLGGSIRIFFQKVISGVLGREFEYPILAAADVDDREVVTYTKDPGEVRRSVAQAERVCLLIRGIIGDTLELRRGLRRAKTRPEGTPLDARYDLILTFDYENLNTPIEDVARALKSRLERVGLGSGHGKTLDIVAHSMGGLVSRWFIENEGGNRVVRKLVMLGTPNGGSPWPNVHDWALTTLAFGLNGLARVAWPASVLGSLVSGLERLDVNLDQMQPGSDFLKALARSPDPGIPYVMLAGNTTLVPAALTIDVGGLSPAMRLLVRILSRLLLHSVAEPFFRGQANDVAVAVSSMETVPGPRTPLYDIRPVA